MLENHLTTVPYTKFILIEDSLREKGADLFDYVVKSQSKRQGAILHYLVCEGIMSRAKKKFEGSQNVIFHDFVTNTLGQNDGKLERLVSAIHSNEIVVIDSLAHAIYAFGLKECYRFLNSIINKGAQQVATILHVDLLLDNKTSQYFKHLSTLHVKTEQSFLSTNKRLHYKYKKQGGKIVTAIEEFKFDNDKLVTFKVEKPDIVKIQQSLMSNGIDPEQLATFRIGLTDSEKESKDKVVLPYLPKDQVKDEGKIIYNLEDIDDWDEEDPDDDLDI